MAEAQPPPNVPQPEAINPDVEIEWTPTMNESQPNGIKPDDIFPIAFSIETKNKALLDGASLHIEYNEHYRSKRFPLEGKSSIKVALKPKENRTEETLPARIECKLISKDEKVIAREIFALKFFYFISNLYLVTGESPRNVLLVGPAGSGKSSFVNSCLSMISHKIIREQAKSGGVAASRVTRSLRVHPLYDVNSRKLMNLRLWDVWGIEKETFTGNEFQLILKGEAPNEWSMDLAKKGDLGPSNNRANAQKRVQNAVIFFVPAGDVDTEDHQSVVRTKAMMEIASELELSCLLVLSKFDSLVPEIEKEGRNCKAAQDRIKKASALFGVEPARVFPLVNYTKEGPNNFFVDRMIYSILNTAADISLPHFLKQGNDLTPEQTRDREIMYPSL